MLRVIIIALSLCIYQLTYSQGLDQTDKDSKVEEVNERDKVLHAEPLYIDLIRDLGARKGEKEWNLGFGLTDLLHYEEYEALVEYEFAPIDRLGFEIEVPVFIYSQDPNSSAEAPSNRIESLKLATQWSFFVNQKMKTSLALGYINEFEFFDLDEIGKNKIIQANKYNPFFVGAKRLGDNFHFLLYTGPSWTLEFNGDHLAQAYEAHFNFHYMIPGTKNFVGLEVNNDWVEGNAHTVLRPQMRVDITEHVMSGLVVGVPVDKSDERMSFFVRLIWEP